MGKLKTQKFYMGISLGFNSSACLFGDRDGLIAAVSEERMIGKKNTKQFPINAIVACLKVAKEMGIMITEIERLSVSYYQMLSVEQLRDMFLDLGVGVYNEDRFGNDWKTYLAAMVEACVSNMECHYFEVLEVTRVDHHTAHALSALVFHGLRSEQSFFVTCDGFGDGVSGRIATLDGEVLSTLGMANSLGLIYQFVTGALGYKEHQHEGKITGLAAFGKPIYRCTFNALYNSFFLKPRTDDMHECLLELDDAEVTNINTKIEDFDIFMRLKKTVYTQIGILLQSGAEPKDIAASLQEFTEDTITSWINNVIRTYFNNELFEQVNLYLAGGLFANVKLNQRIHELDFVGNVFVAPPMGDEGTAVGGAFYVMRDSIGMDKILKRNLIGGKKSALLGTCHNVTTDEVREILFANNFGADKVKVIHALNTAPYIATQLANKKIVCIYQGRMEFGPRALCNRTIMYHCRDASVNSWLNEKLSRTEFMPFAPICLQEYADDLFIGITGARQTAEYMTITFDCTDEFKENYPAACHVDGTARPQIITPTNNPLAHSILEEYYTKTGEKALINTSFNLHNYPIIESPEVAITSWITSGTDILVIGNIIIERR